MSSALVVVYAHPRLVAVIGPGQGVVDCNPSTRSKAPRPGAPPMIPHMDVAALLSLTSIIGGMSAACCGGMPPALWSADSASAMTSTFTMLAVTWTEPGLTSQVAPVAAS